MMSSVNDETMMNSDTMPATSTPSTPSPRISQLDAADRCPPAPLRLRRAMSSVDDESAPCCDTVPRVLIPSVDDHRGLGILAGDFIKPDPGLTLRERETHILSELNRWLEGRIQVHAREAGLAATRDEIEATLGDGMWPAARLHLLVEELSEGETRTPPEELYHAAAVFALGVCERYFADVEPHGNAEEIAIGFVTVDQFSNGLTIADYWNAPSTFEPLREAPPLPLEERIEAAIGFWELPLKVELPLWTWTAGVVWVVLYAWLVAMLVGGGTGR